MAGYDENLYNAPKAEQAEWWRRRAALLQHNARLAYVDICYARAMAEKLDREAKTE